MAGVAYRVRRGKDPYPTRSGMMLPAQHIPEEGEAVARDAWSFAIDDMDRKRIGKAFTIRAPIPAAVPALFGS